jgi:NADH-quinone oxidoreductase subunit L
MSFLPAILAAADAPGPALTAQQAAAAIPHAAAGEGLGWAGWILWLPLISALLCGLCAALKVKGKLPAWITVISLAISSGLVFLLYGRVGDAGPVTIHLFEWISVHWGSGPHESLVADFALYVDSLSLFWMLFVVPLGTLIALYASEYMEPDAPANGGRGYARFFGGVSIFLFAMSCLVLGDNLVMLYLGWEGVGFASYMLVGYYYTKPSAVAAAKKAFIVNRIGDLGLALGIYLTWFNFGSVEFDALFHALAASTGEEHTGGWSVQAIPFLLMLGAFGKSAQVPLYVWLPDAMEGPTPVSALIHAATMVTAGVFLIARMYPFFLLHEAALPVVAWVGGFSALFAATIGMAQYDIKRVMAYSTISQLGYMFLGLGALTSVGACYHVFTHAFFKAVLFLTCGAIMHGFAGQLDLRKLSGLRHMPGWRIVSYTMLVGCLCLSGFTFSSGFFSKDMIIAETFVTASLRPGWGYGWLGWIALITAGLTAYYAFRVWFRVCAGPMHFEPGDEAHGDDHGHAGHGDGHGDGHGGRNGGHDEDHGHASGGAAHAGGFHPHAPRWAINGVLLVLAAGALLAVIPDFVGGGARHRDWIEMMIATSSAASGVPGEAATEAAHHGSAALLGYDPHAVLYYLSSVVGFIGIGIALYFHLLRRRSADAIRATLLSHRTLRWLPTAMENKWYVDELYNATIRMPLWLLGHVLAFIDQYILDALVVDGIARLPRALGRTFQPLQNGVLQGYAVTMAGGVALIVAWVVWVWLQGGAL